MINQYGVKAFSQPYPVLLDHVHGHLFFGGCCFSLSMSIQVIERISDHYRLVQTTTKCSGNHPFRLERHLCEGTSVTLGTPRHRSTDSDSPFTCFCLSFLPICEED